MIEFNNSELMMLSDALLAAIAANNTAMKLTTSQSAINAIMLDNDLMTKLNSRICSMMDENGEDR